LTQILNTANKPFYKAANNIGGWYRILDFVGYLAVITNTLIILLVRDVCVCVHVDCLNAHTRTHTHAHCHCDLCVVPLSPCVQGFSVLPTVVHTVGGGTLDPFDPPRVSGGGVCVCVCVMRMRCDHFARLPCVIAQPFEALYALIIAIVIEHLVLLLK
jgi:hypothetical protein